MSEVISMKRNNSDENTTLAMLANDFIRKMSIHKICRVQKAGGKAILICFEEYYFFLLSDLLIFLPGRSCEWTFCG